MSTPNNYDAAIAASESHKILFENEKVRVMEVTIQPGQTEPLHMHPYKSITIVASPATLKYFDKEGNLISEVEVHGTTWTEPVELHSTENVGTTPFHGYRIELKD